MTQTSNMNQKTSLKPMPIWQTIISFGCPTLVGVIGLYWLLPTLAKAGVPLFWNYMVSVVGMFPFLLLLSIIALKFEKGKISWGCLKDRFRIQSLSKTDWFWTFGLMVVFVGGQLILMPISTWLASTLSFPFPEWLPPALDPRIPKTSIPTEFLGIPLLGSWEIAGAYLFILLLNIIGEEFWWRGYILPRQELRHGRFTWLIHGTLWTLFHIPFWWNLITLLPSTFSLSYVVSKRQNTTPGILVHFIMNGLGFLMILLGILGVAA
ncbi:MAG: CPBP family intramembrane glutamic endopeptidase [Anaerolineales bacterium]